MKLVLDASVTLKWVLQEAGSQAAAGLISNTLLAPEFLRLECANVLAQYERSGKLTAAEVTAGLATIDKAGIVHTADRVLIGAARRLAVELRRSVYDSLYLALALDESAVLVTADGRFAAAVEAVPAYANRLRRL